ncbi:hypothetical protein CBR_g6418 [Chara braunii]|uniref:Uncharacterized protein n=1 Tax=Chara braunii TaxID=69332 RepID=A0A388KJR6_CHABU|nr:hypothetical protein CBR_g6418 [Chara braunii]|eukprot:GBG70291.1 hypothetical protein CBR_g6418 [Chara braunii]
MTSLLVEGDSYGPQRGGEAYGISVGYQAWGMPRGGQWQQPPQGARASGEGELPVGGAASFGRTSYIAGAAPNMHAGVVGGTSTNYYSRPPAANMVGGLSPSMPSDVAFSSHDGRRLHVHDSEISVPEPSQVVADLSEDMDKHDAGMGDMWAGASTDIAGTQSTGNVTMDLTDDGKTDDAAGGDVRKKGKRAGGGGRGRDNVGKAKVRGPYWSSAESVALLKLLFEEDCTRDWVHLPELVFTNDVAARGYRWYDVHVSRLYAMEVLATLGYDDTDLLSDVIFFTKKLHDIIPDEWDGNDRDIVGDIIRHVMSAISEEHHDKMVDTPRYKTVLEPPLRGRPYLHELLQPWDLEEDNRQSCRISSGARTTSATEMSSSPLRNVTEVVDMAGDFALIHRRMIEQAHELARKRGVVFTHVSATVEELKRLREQVDKASMRKGVAVSKAEVAETTIAVLRDEVARLERQLAVYEGASLDSGADRDDHVSNVQNSRGRRGGIMVGSIQGGPLASKSGLAITIVVVDAVRRFSFILTISVVVHAFHMFSFTVVIFTIIIRSLPQQFVIDWDARVNNDVV